MEKNRSFSAKDLCLIAAFTAVTSVLAQMSIPLPGGVPLTLQTFAVVMNGIVLGWRRGGMASLIYLLIGALGVPVFSNFSGGLARLLGPTGGFLLSYPLMSMVSGYFASKRHTGWLVPGLFLSTLINYTLGTLVYVFSTGNSVRAALAACVLPFIITDLLKLILAAWAGLLLRRVLRRAGILENV